MPFANPTRRAAIAAACALLSLSAFAQPFPSKPIKILVGFGPGGTTDAVARLYGQRMSELLNTPVIIENRPGAGQLSAIRPLLQAPADGYTLYAGSGSSLVQNPALRRNLPYDSLKDFTFLGVMVTNPGVITVSNDLPVRTLKELVDYAAAHPDKVNYASAGLGTAGHLAGEALMSATGMKMTHISYKADPDVIRELMAGTVQVGIMTTLNTVSAIKAGKIRGLAVTTPSRLPYLPDVPSLGEVGLKGLAALEPHTFISLVGPAGMAPAVVARLNEAINKVSAAPDVASRVRDGLYAEPTVMTPASFRVFVEKQIATWREVGKDIKLPD